MKNDGNIWFWRTISKLNRVKSQAEPESMRLLPPLNIELSEKREFAAVSGGQDTVKSYSTMQKTHAIWIKI